MKFKQQLQRCNIQQLLDKQQQLQAEINELQQQLSTMQNSYLEKTWVDGNVLIGWTKNSSQWYSNHSNRVQLSPKDKIFSLSSITSTIYTEIADVADRQIAPIEQNRFISVQVHRRLLQQKKKNKQKQISRPTKIATSPSKKTQMILKIQIMPPKLQFESYLISLH